MATITNMQLTTTEAARAFALAGNATLTLRTQGARYTYRVSCKRASAGERSTPWFVGVLTGPDNRTDYAYMGVIGDRGDFCRTARSAVSADAGAARTFAAAWAAIAAGRMPTGIEVWHEGRCGRCGRALTVPESIATGLGPECAERTGGQAALPQVSAPAEAAPVIINDLALSPAMLAQAEDRCHRIGQSEHVTVYYHVATAALDQRVWGMLGDKIAQVGSLTEAGLGTAPISPEALWESLCAEEGAKALLAEAL